MSIFTAKEVDDLLGDGPKKVIIELTVEEANLVACVLSQQADERGDDLSIHSHDDDEIKAIDKLRYIANKLFKLTGVIK